MSKSHFSTNLLFYFLDTFLNHRHQNLNPHIKVTPTSGDHNLEKIQKRPNNRLKEARFITLVDLLIYSYWGMGGEWGL
jgi:hypothetical protein